MEREQESPATFLPALPSLRITTSLILMSAGVAFAATLCADGNYRAAAFLAASAFGAGVLIAGPISVRTIILVWFATTPLASFYVRFPTDRSIVTYNRLVFALVVIMLLVKAGTIALDKAPAGLAAPFWNASTQAVGLSVSRFEIAWALLTVVALASALSRSNNFAYATRIAIDTFGLPLVAFHIARNYQDLRKSGRLLLLGGIAVALSLFATGAFEILTGTD